MSDYTDYLQTMNSSVGTLASTYQMVKGQKLAESNFKLAESDAQYNKWLNSTLMDREDSAIRRRMRDLEAAGLHPALAAGSPAASTPGDQVHTEPKENVHTENAERFLGLSQLWNNLFMSQAQRKLILAQAKKTNYEADQLLPGRVKHLSAQDDLISSNISLNSLRGQYYERQVRREDRYYQMMDTLDETNKAKLENVLAVTRQIEYDLQYSQEHDLRTTDHSVMLQLVNFLDNKINKVVDPMAKGLVDTFGSIEGVPQKAVDPRKMTEFQSRELYDAYLRASHKANRSPMSWVEWEQLRKGE